MHRITGFGVKPVYYVHENSNFYQNSRYYMMYVSTIVKTKTVKKIACINYNLNGKKNITGSELLECHIFTR